jgi:hypothetical protein
MDGTGVPADRAIRVEYGPLSYFESRRIAAAIRASESLTLHMNSAIPSHAQTAKISENIDISPFVGVSSSRGHRGE